MMLQSHARSHFSLDGISEVTESAHIQQFLVNHVLVLLCSLRWPAHTPREGGEPLIKETRTQQ